MPRTDPEKRLEYQREWSTKNRDKIKEYNKRNWERNGDKLRKYNREKYREYTKEQKARWSKNYREKNKEKIKEQSKERNKGLRIKVIHGYGGKCVHCGFSDWRALCIDHINGGGRLDREKKQLYTWLRDNNYPDGYQILCANCNLIKAIENKEIGKQNDNDNR